MGEPRQLPFAWRILSDGVCDGCALGTSGLCDWTLPGTHLCMVRLELMRLNTAPALDMTRLRDARGLRRSVAGLRELGRLPEPMLRRRGDAGFRVITGTRRSIASPPGCAITDPTHGVLSHLPRHHQRGLLRRAEGGAGFSAPTTSTTPRRLCHAASTSR